MNVRMKILRFDLSRDQKPPWGIVRWRAGPQCRPLRQVVPGLLAGLRTRRTLPLCSELKAAVRPGPLGQAGAGGPDDRVEPRSHVLHGRQYVGDRGFALFSNPSPPLIPTR